MNERENMLRDLQICDFALIETNLYLDGHPYNRDARNYFFDTLHKRDEILNEYTEKYGPITVYDSKSAEDGEFTWTIGAWPWEMSEEE
ncbi:MAG: spore coat protein CotJB [Clostridia bacterium]|nr:spore coat protein CotJB [Clostridia bacterium]